MILLLYIILLFILIIIFLIYSYYLKKIVLIKENFYQDIDNKCISDQIRIDNLSDYLTKEQKVVSNNNSCQGINDKCIIDQNGKHNCCKGYYCVRQDGNFQYKVCSDKPDPYSENKDSNQTEFQKLVTTTVDKASKFKDTISKKFEDLTEEEQLTLSVKDFCSSPYKIQIPNLFYGIGKNKKECDCSEEKDIDPDFDPDLFGDINFNNCQFFPV
jgi:hypothetical protein